VTMPAVDTPLFGVFLLRYSQNSVNNYKILKYSYVSPRVPLLPVADLLKKCVAYFAMRVMAKRRRDWYVCHNKLQLIHNLLIFQTPKIRQLLASRGPNCFRETTVNNALWELHFAASVLWLQGKEAAHQPVVDSDGNILLWNGDIFSGLHKKVLITLTWIDFCCALCVVKSN
jgi:hypothetical protein